MKLFKSHFRLPSSIKLIGGLSAFVIVGTLLLMLPISSSGDHIAWNEALFTAVSALCVTGLSVIDVQTELTAFGKIILMLLIQAGGIGYMVFAVLVFRVLGRSISLTDRTALQDSLGLLNPSGIVELTRRVFFTVLIVEFVGALLLYFHWLKILGEPGRTAFYAMFHAVSAFCNAGFDLFGGDIPNDGYSLTIMGILIILGGLGIPVLYDSLTYYWNRRFTLHTRLTVIASVILIVWGTIAILICEAPSGVLAGESTGRQVGLALFQSISARTAGFMGIHEFAQFSSPGQLLIITLMFIGCAPASMGGGITTGTFIVLVLALIAYAKKRSTPIVQGKAIPGEMVRKAAAVLTISLFAVITATWIILLTHDTTLNMAFFEVVSAFATCGLSLGLTQELNGIGYSVIILMMFWGRLGALTILFAFTRRVMTKRITFPEEKVLIG